ncbi:predicted protein [Chaetomium globosum CBS 148.51]|uniref:Uncharacterized protein n=1 Tax=Chaetomium globosum (strain ATCC 6205 / CBS 148.51 / DSM 1962 / NBRC 6347 / NRRL 1970) TaxID=306901 RepID=Q2H2T3_CHAGB|nr:uncharacterized protein CHGG_03913 [Chaetomium globosum CBS 148.51]EAQ87294.1 predicted protein [Chaetomium globosum CBS 148.51]
MPALRTQQPRKAAVGDPWTPVSPFSHTVGNCNLVVPRRLFSASPPICKTLNRHRDSTWRAPGCVTPLIRPSAESPERRARMTCMNRSGQSGRLYRKLLVQQQFAAAGNPGVACGL